MKGFLLFVIVLLSASGLYSQKLSADDFLYASTFSTKKFESFLSRHKFVRSGMRVQNDTVINIYDLKPPRKKKNKDTLDIKRAIEAFYQKDNTSFTYFTSVKNEFVESINDLKQRGFFCGQDRDTNSMLFQRKNVTVLANIAESPEDTIYSLFFHQEELPLPEKIEFAEDLLQFRSHEYLVGVFGQANVIRDVYYFSEKDIAKCSILFPKTSRQAVFIWEDQINQCKPSHLIIGGNMNTNSSANYDGVIGENVWSSKEGVYSGMSLISLIKLNGNSFKFYGKNATVPYMIVPENTGTLNFRKKMIVLGCLNPGGSKLLNNPMVSADEILDDNLGLYVFMMMIVPSTLKNE